MLDVNKIYCCDCLEGMKQMEDNVVDLTVCSPPYDSHTRSYGGIVNEDTWNFEVFKPIAHEIYRVTKPGGIVVWVVGDETINGSESGSSFRQALYFMECGFKLHDTMIYEKNSSSFPARRTSKRYSQIFEYMFVFVKGKIRNDITLIADKRNKWAGWTNWGQHSQYDQDGNLLKTTNIKPIQEFSLRNNIWKYSVSFNDRTGHPAVFPEKLAEDHILSWTNEGDLVLDPFMGSGTTAKMCILNKRGYIGFEKNPEYVEMCEKRLARYTEAYKENATYTAEVDDFEDGAGELQVLKDGDDELEAKTVLFNQLVDELNKYFNEQSLSILKTLKLKFESKANDERVNKRVKGEL